MYQKQQQNGETLYDRQGRKRFAARDGWEAVEIFAMSTDDGLLRMSDSVVDRVLSFLEGMMSLEGILASLHISALVSFYEEWTGKAVPKQFTRARLESMLSKLFASL